MMCYKDNLIQDMFSFCKHNVSLLPKLHYFSMPNKDSRISRLFMYRLYNKYKLKHPTLYCIDNGDGIPGTSVWDIANNVIENCTLTAVPILARTYCQYRGNDTDRFRNCSYCAGHLLVVYNNQIWSLCLGYSTSESSSESHISVFTKHQLQYLKKHYKANIKICEVD